MKNKLFLIAAVLLSASCNRSVNQKFAELDRDLKRADIYMESFRHRADSLEHEITESLPDSLKWNLCYDLFSSFIHINLDSTLYYCNKLERYASNEDLAARTVACRLNCLRLSGKIKDMASLAEEIDVSKVSPGFLSDYYFHLQRAFDRVYDSLAVKYIHESISNPNVSQMMKARMRGLLCIRAKDIEGTLEQFRIVYDNADTYHMKAMASFNLSRAYQKVNDEDNAIYWMTEAAINDIKAPCKEYASLPELSMMLIQTNRYRRASSYLNISMKDAIGGQWNKNVFNYAEGQISIANSMRHSANVMIVCIVLLIMFLVVIWLMYVGVFRQKRELHRINGIISEMNNRLTDEGTIKEAYLFRYMALAVEYLGKLESYRHDLRQAMKEGGMDAVKAMLRAPEQRNVYKEFYEKFDTTFQKIYPDFVPKVNLLLKEEARFREGIPFCTDLRILATIRLGFHESRQIAAFLNVPATSIYTRRSAIRRSAICKKEEFEGKVRQII